MITSLMAECVYEYCLDVKRPPTQTARCERCGDTYLVEYKVLVDPDGTRRKLTCPHRACYPLRYREYMSLPGLRYCKLQHFPVSLIFAAGRWVLPPVIERIRNLPLDKTVKFKRCSERASGVKRIHSKERGHRRRGYFGSARIHALVWDAMFRLP